MEGSRYWNRKVVPLLSYESGRWPFVAKTAQAHAARRV